MSGKCPMLRTRWNNFNTAIFNLSSLNFNISFKIPSGPLAFLGCRVWILASSSSLRISQSEGFWLSLTTGSSVCSLLRRSFWAEFSAIELYRSSKCFLHISPFWIASSSLRGLLKECHFCQKLFELMDFSIKSSWCCSCCFLLVRSVFLYNFSVSQYCRRSSGLSGCLCFWFDKCQSVFLRCLQPVSNHFSLADFFDLLCWDFFQMR